MARKKKATEIERDDIAPGLVVKTKKRLVVAAGSSHPELAQQVAAELAFQQVTAK
jgi:ribose-phosphate pyrophosphokinase